MLQVELTAQPDTAVGHLVQYTSAPVEVDVTADFEGAIKSADYIGYGERDVGLHEDARERT